ncbi:c-type cytochrome [Methylobacterium soli]|uniref:C-type cytochrome n=2 Tax=Methylobacterium soli TaxID=553447 RepID=A0A6L3SZ01_9HYPH|nr:c-type cytochrome [Methylobacterium soli]KAB1079274.1 c-type cytochrome [Methylobacterium soli]
MRIPLALAVATVLTGPVLAAGPSIEGCTACHGAGTSQTEGIPSLGGMPALYVTNQLFMFREGQRKADPMNSLAEPMSDEDLQAYGAAIATLPAPTYQGPAADAERVARANAAIAKHRCASCHGAQLGGDKGVPRIRGQREEYLVTALTTYKTSERAGFDPQMNEVAGELSPNEIADLAYAIARKP